MTKSLNTSWNILQYITDEGKLFELEEENIRTTGICLTNEMIGTSIFIYGNTLIHPTPLLMELLEIHPSADNPLIWVNNENEKILEYEQFSYPKRDTIRELYFRQPLMGRWLGNKKIDKLLKEYRLTKYTVSTVKHTPDIK